MKIDEIPTTVWVVATNSGHREYFTRRHEARDVKAKLKARFRNEVVKMYRVRVTPDSFEEAR